MALPSDAFNQADPRGRTPWRPAPAVLVAAAASFAPILLWFVPVLAERFGFSAPAPVSPNGLPPISSPVMLAQMIAGQILSFGIIWLAAGWKGARTPTLRLGSQQAGWAESIGYGLLLIALILPLELLMYRIAGLDLFTDSRWLLEGLRSPLWWGVVIVAVVLAPLWEEVTFRGFLLSALAQTRLGFWPAATISSLLWTVLHFGYSWPGLVSVFLAGIGLSWIIRRTGSMRAAVVAHAVVNAFSLIVVSTFAP
jgi:uncharacterized protein